MGARRAFLPLKNIVPAWGTALKILDTMALCTDSYLPPSFRRNVILLVECS